MTENLPCAGSRRLVAIDLDGTLLRSDHTVSDRSRDAVAAASAAGWTVIVATARSPRSARLIAHDAGIGGIAICANGATLYDLDAERIVSHRPLSPEVAHRLVRGLRERVPGIVFGWEHALRFASEPAYEERRDPSWWTRPEGSYPPSDPLEWTMPMTKLLGRLPDARGGFVSTVGTGLGEEQASRQVVGEVDAMTLEQALAEAIELCQGEAAATLTGTAFIELMAAGVSKETALAELAQQAGVGAADVVAFGDHVTDAGMLAWAGLGVAVANAHPTALAAADEVTSSNDDDGVAVVIERLLGIRGH